MREIKRERLIEDRDKLLFDILKELKQINNPDTKCNSSEILINKKPIVAEKTNLFDCKYCGGKHEHTWQIGLCAKKNKKKEGVG